MELETEIIPMRANGMACCRPPVSGSRPAALSSCPGAAGKLHCRAAPSCLLSSTKRPLRLV